MIERYVHWNEDIGEWQLKCVAYTGNNMKKQQALTASIHGLEVKKKIYYFIFSAILFFFIFIFVFFKLSVVVQTKN